MLNIKKLFRDIGLIIAVLFIVSCAGTTLRDWPIQTGRVLVEGTGKPVADAYVIARWQGQTSALADTRTRCYHVEVTKTDKNGNFNVPAWNESLRHGVMHGKLVFMKVYKKGYVASEVTYAKHTYIRNIYYQQPYKGSRTERMDYLFDYQYKLRCSRKSNYKLYKVIYAMYEEAKGVAITEKEKKRAEHLKGWANDVLDASKSDVVPIEQGWKRK